MENSAFSQHENSVVSIQHEGDVDGDVVPPIKRCKIDELSAEERDGVDGRSVDITQLLEEDDSNVNKLMPHDYVREEDVFITEYVTPHHFISGVVKQRYSDFLVHEVSQDGEMVHLTSMDVPADVSQQVSCSSVDQILPESFLDELKLLASDSREDLTACLPVDNDKTKRLHIHRAVKAAFPNLDTKTEDKEDGQRVITVMKKVSRGGAQSGNSKRFDWPSDKKLFPYCRFVLYKENKSTMEALHLLAKYVRCKQSVFSIAGTKDRRGITTQEVTAFRIHPRRLHDANSFLQKIKVGNFWYTDRPLRPGDLTGNHFTIILRNLQADCDDLTTGLSRLFSSGFINYFGLQRFGTHGVRTDHVGRLLLLQKWEQAVDLLLGGEGTCHQAFRQTWLEQKDAEMVLGMLTPQAFLERSMLRHLVKHPSDFLGAINTMTRSMRTIYPHAYQSLVWNVITSRRLQVFGLQPVVGDLVMTSPAVKDTGDGGDDMGHTSSLDTSIPSLTDMTDLDGGVESGVSGDRKRRRPIVVDQSRLSEFTIYDVVLPLPGFDVIYPENEVRSWYREQLAMDGLDIDNMKLKQRDFSLSGKYRAILALPDQAEWSVLNYIDVSVPLVTTDLDLMNVVKEPETVDGGELQALRLSFTLPASSYATMLLRELLKTDTSPVHQASMNVT